MDEGGDPAAAADTACDAMQTCSTAQQTEDCGGMRHQAGVNEE
jgi:hypothetical protein